MSAAFFDIDGTLLRKPSLERRFFWDLHRRRKIPAANYFRFLADTLLRLGEGAPALTLQSKSYLRGIPADLLAEGLFLEAAARLPRLFPAAVHRIWQHALRGDAIVLVTGSLAPLAETVGFALERELLCRGVETKIGLLATRLEVREGRWTGRVLGAPMFAEAKALAIGDFSAARGIALSQCSAYGDSHLDRWMLASVGNPYAVNPTRRMLGVARVFGWPTLTWNHSLENATDLLRKPNEVALPNPEPRLKWGLQGGKAGARDE